MPPKKRKKDGSAKNSNLLLHCEWGSCSDVYNVVENLTVHLGQHLKDIYGDQELNTVMEYHCLWRNCEMKITGLMTDFIRHVYFHAFHTRIKYLGTLLIEAQKLKGCQLDTQSRNLIPELPERLQCGWKYCETILDIPEVFYRHVESHCESFAEGNHVPDGCACAWDGCDTVLKNKYKLREHLRSHTQEKVVACPTCGGLFSSRTKFVDHIKRQEDTNVQCFQCSHCYKQFSTERLLRDHVRHHVNQYKCPCCDMTCPTPSSLKLHLRYRHTDEKPYKCDHCGHGTKSVADLKKHLESHSSEDPFQCEVAGCNYTCRTFQSYDNHFKRMHQEVDVQKYACHVCDNVFTRGGNLTQHLKRKHKFRWPSGHSRFRYKMHDDGYLRLQTVRYESIRLTEQIEQSESRSNSPSIVQDGNNSQDGNDTEDNVQSEQTSNVQTSNVQTSNIQTSSVQTSNIGKSARNNKTNGSEQENEDSNKENDAVILLGGDTGYYREVTEGETGNVISQTSVGVETNTDQHGVFDLSYHPNAERPHVPTHETVGPFIITSEANNLSMPEIGPLGSYGSVGIIQPLSVVPMSSSNYTSGGSVQTMSTGDTGCVITIPSYGASPSKTQNNSQVVEVTCSDSVKENMAYNLEMLGDVALLVPVSESNNKENKNQSSLTQKVRKRKRSTDSDASS